MEKYISKAEAAKLEKPDEKKVVISDDAFAVCDLIEQLIKKAEHLRISSIIRR
jgi:hypothetical protein